MHCAIPRIEIQFQYRQRFSSEIFSERLSSIFSMKMKKMRRKKKDCIVHEEKFGSGDSTNGSLYAVSAL